jgi:acetylornithine deacetylase/succinyl-diaminopimelate desuccinylase-like protein
MRVKSTFSTGCYGRGALDNKGAAAAMLIEIGRAHV